MSSPTEVKSSPTEVKIFDCAICTSTFVDPCTTSCGHSFCLLCWKGHVESKASISIPCPICREPNPRELKVSVVLRDAARAYMKMNDPEAFAELEKKQKELEEERKQKILKEKEAKEREKKILEEKERERKILEEKAGEKILTIITKDKVEYLIAKRIACVSRLIDTCLDYEEQATEIPIPGVKSEIMVYILEWMMVHNGIEDEKLPWNRQFIEGLGDRLVDVCCAANYMDIHGLLRCCANRLVELGKASSLDGALRYAHRIRYQ